MSSTNRDYGAEIRMLHAELRDVGFGTGLMTVLRTLTELQRSLDGRASLLKTTQRRRDALVKEREWINSDVHGYERGLALVGAGDTEPLVAGSGRRLQERLDTRISEAAEISGEIEELDRRIGVIESDVVAYQEEMLRVLRRSIADSEQKACQVAQIRRKRVAEQWAELDQADRTGMWSPFAVMGYRIWMIRKDGLYGSWKLWDSPQLTAVCSKGDRVPHTDGRCATVAFGCGIYAAKSVDRLMSEIGGGTRDQFAVGLVGLEGKVIEHERGYRAERATVLALSVVDRGELKTIDDLDEIDELFANRLALPTLGTIRVSDISAVRTMRSMIKHYLEDQEGRYATWTSADHNG